MQCSVQLCGLFLMLVQYHMEPKVWQLKNAYPTDAVLTPALWTVPNTGPVPWNLNITEKGCLPHSCSADSSSLDCSLRWSSSVARAVCFRSNSSFWRWRSAKVSSCCFSFSWSFTCIKCVSVESQMVIQTKKSFLFDFYHIQDISLRSMVKLKRIFWLPQLKFLMVIRWWWWWWWFSVCRVLQTSMGKPCSWHILGQCLCKRIRIKKAHIDKENTKKTIFFKQTSGIRKHHIGGSHSYHSFDQKG